MPLVSNLQIRRKLLAVILPLVMVPVLITGVIVGYVSQQQAHLEVTQAGKIDADIRDRILIGLGLLTPLVGLIAGVLAVRLSRELTAPVHTLLTGVREVQQGRLNTRLPVTSGDELGELTREFNSMMEVLERNKILTTNLVRQNRLASLSALSLGLARQIENPLGTILGHAAYLEGKMIPSDPKYKYVQEIKRESKRCKAILQSLLSHVRMPESSFENTDINALLDEIVDFTVDHMEMNAVRVEKAFERDLPRIRVDRDQLRQAAFQLMLNAGAAVNHDGRLIVGTSSGSDNTIRLTFEDNGIGIASEHMEKIFEPFFTIQSRNMGLGLTITKAIIERHGGTIRIESEPGRGTRVIITLSIDGEPADSPSVDTYSAE